MPKLTDGALPGYESDPSSQSIHLNLIAGAQAHDIQAIEEAIGRGANINFVHPDTGLSALHIAVGQNDLSLCSFLIENCGANFFPDKFGRWPTLIAAECQVDDELADYIAQKEAASMGHDYDGMLRDDQP